MKRLTLRRGLVALAMIIAFVCQGTWALAGTTGGLSGVVTDSAGAPVAGVAVKASSASQTATATTDARGHFTFISLSPDTYTVSAEKQGYSPASLAGVTVFADQNLTVSMTLSKALKTIAVTTATAAGNLVKSGTTSDVYSVNSATATAVQGIGGGYNLDSAYSAVYSQPGVTSSIGNYGFGQVYYIRGSAYSQIGYEYDGVPVNRAFDNYNANSLSSLGTQETEVYAGGSSAGASSATLGGYINQVIKTGTYPGTGTLVGGLGSPTFYHKLSVETGGATPNRLFSYYIGLSGVNQQFPFITNNQAAGLANDGSNAYGFTGPSLDPIVTAFSPAYNNGPWPTCTATGAAPSGAPTFEIPLNGGGYLHAPTCQAYGPLAANYNIGIRDRENVFNFHFGIPHKKDGGRDDVQALLYNFAYQSTYNDGLNALGGAAYWNNQVSSFTSALGNADPATLYPNLCGFNEAFGHSCATTGLSPIPVADNVTLPVGTGFGQSATGVTAVPYLIPGYPTNRPVGVGVDPNLQDAIWNDGTVVKLQYQKNFGSTAFARVLGYSFYSDWLQTAPNDAGGNISFFIPGMGNSYPSPDYELNTHTRGLQLDVEDQINEKNLLSFIANYTTATVTRWNNQFYGFSGNGINLTDGTNCYNTTGGAINSCLSGATAVSDSSLLPGGGGLPPIPAGAPAGASYRVTVPGGYGPINQVQPRFSNFSLSDVWQPTDKWNVNLGVREEVYQYVLGNTVNPEFNFWFNQAANSYCYDPATGSVMLIPVSPSTPPNRQGPVVAFNRLPGENPGLCYTGAGAALIAPSGQQAVHPNGVGSNRLYTNVAPSTLSHTLFSPRLSGTYTINPDTVLRFSAGRYTQPTETAFEQYTNASGLGAAKFDYTYFWNLGFNNPAHDNPVQTSNNYDFSYERHFKGTDWTLKISPFYRYTTNELVTVSLGGNFASGINAGTQKSKGIEVAIAKGDPSRNGLSGELAWTLSSADVKYNNLSNGTNAIDAINNYIVAFNGLTSACAPGGSLAGTSSCPSAAIVAAPYYCVNGAGPNGSNGPAASAAACGANPAIQNPYYNMNAQSLLDRNGYYPAYANNPPQSVGQDYATTIPPNTFSGFLNYKKNKFTATASFQLNEGAYYGNPLAVEGLDPRNCVQNEGQASASLVGTAYANLPDYQTCGSSSFTAGAGLAVPNPLTGKFDTLSQYREPWQFNLGLQFAYDFTPKIHGVLTLANVVNRCFGGSNTPWKSAYQPNNYDCGWLGNAGGYVGSIPGEGFFYGASPTASQNGTTGYPNWMNQPYSPVNGALPFQAYFQLQFRL